MKHCAKKLLGFAFALALCLAVGGTALADGPEAADAWMLADEPNVTTAPDTTTVGDLANDGYTVTIPTTVEVNSGENKDKLKVKAQLKQWRTLNIGITSQNSWQLKYQDAAAGADTPKVDYTLSEGTSDDVPADCEWQYQPDTKTLSFSTTKMQPGTSLEEDMKRVRSSSYELPITVPTPSQATMSGTYSDTVSFEFDLTKQCVTYFINVYEQELKLTNSGTHVQAVDVVDANGNVIGDPTPKLTQTFEYPLQNEDHRWTYSSDDPEDDKLRWEELPTATMNADRDNKAGKTNVTFNLNLKRKWYWLDVNGITNKETCTKCETDGNQGGRIAGFVNIKVSVDDGTNWSDWFWYSDGDDYWGTFPYGTEFQLGLHRVKDGYAYDEENGEVAIYANGTLAYTQDTDISLDKRTNYRVYKGKLEGEPVDKTLHPTKWGGISHAAGSYPRYCYNVCFVDGITYYANGGTGGREDTNAYHGAHTTFQYTAGMTLADPITDCAFIAPDGKEFAGWSTTKDYTAGQPLYAAGADVSSVTTWPTRPGTSNHDTLPTGDGQTVCRTLYAIWKKPYTVKVQFGGIIGWTTWDAANQSFPEKLQGGDSFDTAVELGKAYAYGNTSLTLSATENTEVWNALQTKITEKTSAIADTTPPKDVWQLKDAYTFTTLPANGEVTIQIKRKRYLLNVIPALKNDTGGYTPVSDATDAEQYGKFNLDSCGVNQTAGEKVSYYQHMRNYGGSYRIYNVEANAGYRFVGFERPTDKGPTTTDGTGNLTGKNTDIHYFGDRSGREYTGDTIYVMYKKDMVTFDFNGGKNQEGETKTEEQYDPKSFIQKMSFQNNGTSYFIGWSLNKVEQPGETIYKPDSTRLGDIQWPDSTKKVLYARWSTGPNRAPARKALTLRYHANFDPMEELALDLDPNPLLEDMDEDFGFEPDPLPEDILDPTVEAVKIVTYKPGEDVVLRNCMFKRSGYVFVGWNTEPDGTGIKYEVDGVPRTDWAAGDTVDLYAQWKKPDHLKPVVDNEPFVPTDPDTPPEELDPGFGIDPDADPADEEGPADDADAVDDAPAVADEEAAAAPPEELDFGFGIDSDAAVGGPAPFVRW